ncbi:dTDP-glucose 4,6-dehydratase [Psychromonas sp. RZ22]|uniref:dTDP-glucose 4,6-dehydratase n=1 Tax=Psychromonas algarum TaxID=2555643 RepID=UPI0010682A07|nr:dTDP-glucose 4,6-dehydratase [Psychromonas sp. RZ22]TEW53994.1 dTDP-glucose 4,6-dehydratase [Psychromonas sp. RZ22]
MYKNNKIGILGSGWLGKPLAMSLQSEVESIYLSTRSQLKVEQLSDNNITAYVIDIEALGKNIQTFLQVETLIINITCKDISAYQKLLIEIEKSAVKYVLFISSTSVYPRDHSLSKESDILKIETNLRLIEKLFTENTHFDCTVIRFAGLIGPKRHPGRFFITGKDVKDANARVNLIHQADCIKLIKTILKQEAWREIFNGCADNHPTKKDYYSAMAKSLGYPEPNCLVIENSATKIICNEKIKKQLGYQFIYPDIEKVCW